MSFPEFLLKFSSTSSISFTSVGVSEADFSTWTFSAVANEGAPRAPARTDVLVLQPSPNWQTTERWRKTPDHGARPGHKKCKQFSSSVQPSGGLHTHGGFPGSCWAADPTGLYILCLCAGTPREVSNFPCRQFPASHWEPERMSPVPALSPGDVRNMGGGNALPRLSCGLTWAHKLELLRGTNGHLFKGLRSDPRFPSRKV